MPPRKKAAAAAATTDGADASTSAKPSTRATRASTRNKAASSQVATVADVANGSAPPSKDKAASAPASKAKAAKAPASKSKGKAKRIREESEGEDEPDSKKAKVDDDADEDKPEPPAKMITVLKRGAAPVDPCSGFVDTHIVHADDEAVWDAMLNQTDVGKNANKFYVIQVLRPINDNNNFTLFTRWGRVGENGQQQKKGPFPATTAVAEFKKQFKAKAGITWEQRHGMIAGKGKYTWLERDFEDTKEEIKEEDKKGESSEQKEPEKIPDSRLDPEVQTLCKLIFSTKLMDAHLSAMNYDVRKLPLGKLAKSTILNGFTALKALSEVVADPNCDAAKQMGGFHAAVAELTGRYYSIIPHVFGRNRPTIIDDAAILKRELELVDALGDMEIASKLIAETVNKDELGEPINPLDGHFRSLRLNMMSPVNKNSTEYTALTTYVSDTHGATHGHIQPEVQYAFRVERQAETDAWIAAGHDKLADGARYLLWHGSRTTNFAGILKQGLRIAPPEAPVTGYMFGKGVYFADMMSKSAGYCYAGLSNNMGLMLLCEVAVKPFFEQKNANYYADTDCKAANAMCTKGLGRTQPGNWTDAGEALSNDALKGCHMPKGRTQDVTDPAVYLQYNEYIVYDPSQIRLRYLLMVKM